MRRQIDEIEPLHRAGEFVENMKSVI